MHNKKASKLQVWIMLLTETLDEWKAATLTSMDNRFNNSHSLVMMPQRIVTVFPVASHAPPQQPFS